MQPGEAPPSRPMTTSRQRDRRRGFAELLLALAGTVDRRDEIALLRDTFEQAVRRIVPVRTAHLRNLGERWSRRSDVPPGPESIALDVHGAGVLEATFEPGAPLGEWDFQSLDLAAHIGALVLEIERSRRQLAQAGLLTVSQRHDGPPPLIGSAPAMLALRAAIERVAATDFTVLIEGESGVGKELVSRQIHERSRRHAGPFVVIDCAALDRSVLATADGGTLFLDEVSDLSAAGQANVLRGIKELTASATVNSAPRADTRVIAATNRRLVEMVRERTFRPDLFYLLSGLALRVPALRERRADIIELARYFLAHHRGTRRRELSDAATEALLRYNWPANVRELERLIESAVALAPSDTIALEDLPAPVGGPYVASLGPSLERQDTLRVWARRYVRIVLADCGGNKRQAARRLGISYHTLQGYVSATENIEEQGTA